MPLTFPIAGDAQAALEASATARTIREAREHAGEAVTLVSEWLRPDEVEHARLKPKLDAGVTQGFVQVYEDAKERPVIAVTYWKPDSFLSQSPPPLPPLEPTEDHTDDLYFDKTPRPSPRRRPRALNPNQLDLFEPGKPAGGSRST